MYHFILSKKMKGYYGIHLTQQVVSNISQNSALPPMCCKNFEPIAPQGFNVSAYSLNNKSY